MVEEFRGRDKWSDFLNTLVEADREGGTISPGGGGILLGVSRQRVYELVQTFRDVRAWAFYEGNTRQATVYEVSIRDLLRWGVRSGRIQGEADLGYRSPKVREILAEVLQSEGDCDRLPVTR